ncbi:hypothetical protein [Gottfriedia acidiceleris]|uniref:hypothetical protein n=1 Tax=Gottfriedia acidiceleris TaxID=371036 RepID=UPI000B43F689|nr:hypothetical protein [Gottfriedia acidiceleris]
MTNDRKTQLEKLLKKNKIKQAKIQLVDDLKNYHEIDISNKAFAEYQLSEEAHNKIYDRIKTGKIKTLKFPYDEDTIISKIDFIFNYYKDYVKEIVLFYPSTFGFYSRSSNQLYLEYPIALTLPLLECKNIIMKLMLEMHDDLVVVSEELNFGFVFSEDEYSDVTIEYWGK